MSNIVIDIAAQFTGKKAFKEADFTAKRLNQSVKNLAATFGVAFSARAFVNYSKMAVKAFAADDKAARTLTQTLNNLGLAFADTEVKTFISDLEKQFGVLDDYLRPAYQKLITTTGDFRKSQDLLKVALDLSAQSGFDVVSVSNDLSQALIGNTKGLRKYNLGLTTAQLSAMSFEEVLARITKISAGQASLAADTYSGKLDKLKVAAANAEEVLGGAFLDTFIKLSGGDVDKATAAIDKYSTGLATMLRLLTGVISKQEVLSKVDFKFGLIPVEKGKVSSNRSASPAGTFVRNAAEIKAAAAAKKLAEDQAKTQKALTKAQQDALKLAKSKAVFDLQKISIEAALKGKISAEDEIRLKLMKAIVDENLTEVEKYQKALDLAQTKTKELTALLAEITAIDIKDPFGNFNIDPVTAAINALTTSIGGVSTVITATGVEFSTLTGNIATTAIQPNLKEWSSSFNTANQEVTASLTTATSAITKIAADAATALGTSLTTATNNATKTATDATASLLTTSKAATILLNKLLIDGSEALTNAGDEATASLTILATDTLDSVTADLGKITAELAAAIAAAAAQAAADAADLAGAGTAAFNNAVTVIVEGSVIAQNDLATIVNDAINNSSAAGNAVGFNRTATSMAIE
jgi:hypothetical protein